MPFKKSHRPLLYQINSETSGAQALSTPYFPSFVFLPHRCVPQSGLDLEKTDVYGIVFAEHEKMKRAVRTQAPYHPSGS